MMNWWGPLFCWCWRKKPLWIYTKFCKIRHIISEPNYVYLSKLSSRIQIDYGIYILPVWNNWCVFLKTVWWLFS